MRPEHHGGANSSWTCRRLQCEKLPPRQRRNWFDVLRSLIHSARKDCEPWPEACVAMIDKRTVFILGAGASCPYGFPTARGLRAKILSNFKTWYERYLYGDGDGIDDARIGRGYPEPTAVGPFLRSFDLSGTESIDLFLSRNPRFEKVGKMAICLSIH